MLMRALRYGIRWVACYAVCCAVIGAVLAEVAFRPARVPISKRSEAQAAVVRYGAILRDVSVVAADGVRLQGWFARPAESNGDAIILFHGVGDNRQGTVGLAELFLSRGYTVLLPDSRGHGASGGFPTYGIKEVGDVREWFHWLSTNNRPRCVFGMGESMGAVIMLSAVKEVPFCAVVAESPFANFQQVAYLRIGQFLGQGSWLGKSVLRPAIEFAFLYGWLRRDVWLSDASPESSVARSRVPILLIHGLADTNIPFHQSEMILARNPGSITLWKVPNSGHCGARGVARDEFDARVPLWFASHREIEGHNAYLKSR
jgi:uncharacterized protein